MQPLITRKGSQFLVTSPNGTVARRGSLTAAQKLGGVQITSLKQLDEIQSREGFFDSSDAYLLAFDALSRNFWAELSRMELLYKQRAEKLGEMEQMMMGRNAYLADSSVDEENTRDAGLTDPASLDFWVSMLANQQGAADFRAEEFGWDPIDWTNF